MSDLPRDKTYCNAESSCDQLGISVSGRVGNAQIKAMKKEKVAGTLKLEVKLSSVSWKLSPKFWFDLDATTKLTIERGEKKSEIFEANHSIIQFL